MQGFEAAFDDLAAALGQGGSEVLTLPIDLVTEDVGNPRSRFDEAEIAALAETIRARGVLQPITVGPAGPDGRYPLRFGARRLRAARVAGLTEVPALVRGTEGDEADAIAEQVIENDQRTGLSTGEMADAVARLLKLGRTQAEVGRMLGRPKDQIAMLAAVAKRPPAMRALGDGVGLRTLYELQSAWKQDAAAVERWLESRDPDSISQAEARALAARVGRGRNRPIRDTAPPHAPPADIATADSAPAPKAVGGARLGVSVGRRRGVLVLDTPADASGRALVRFDDSEAAEPVELGKLKIVSLDVG